MQFKIETKTYKLNITYTIPLIKKYSTLSLVHLISCHKV